MVSYAFLPELRVQIYKNFPDLLKTESLVLWARSEMIGSAIGNICSWFQVSGFSAAAGREHPT
jgi:hypothetical protein